MAANPQTNQIIISSLRIICFATVTVAIIICAKKEQKSEKVEAKQKK